MPKHRNFDFIHKKVEMTVSIYADSNAEAEHLFLANVKDPEMFRPIHSPLTFDIDKEYTQLQTGLRIKITGLTGGGGYYKFEAISPDYKGLTEFHPESDFAKYLVEAE